MILWMLLPAVMLRIKHLDINQKRKKMLSKFFIGLALINLSFSNCSSPTKKNMNNEEPREVCQSFVKAICTKDTVTFYKLVDRKSLTASMNEWVQDGKRITDDDLFFPFFFVYSPLKIRNQDLMNARSMSNFFKSFTIVNNETIDNENIKLSLEWVQNLPEAEPQKIELYLRKNEEWKVVKARWDTL